MNHDYDIYEVLIQERPERFPVNVGSVRAANETLALHHAREIFARRERCVKLMVVKRNAIAKMENVDFLDSAHQKSYRQASLNYHN